MVITLKTAHITRILPEIERVGANVKAVKVGCIPEKFSELVGRGDLIHYSHPPVNTGETIGAPILSIKDIIRGKQSKLSGW